MPHVYLLQNNTQSENGNCPQRPQKTMYVQSQLHKPPSRRGGGNYLQMGLELGIWNWYSAAYSIMSSVIILRIADTRRNRARSLGELGIWRPGELENQRDGELGIWRRGLDPIACVSADFWFIVAMMLWCTVLSRTGNIMWHYNVACSGRVSRCLALRPCDLLWIYYVTEVALAWLCQLGLNWSNRPKCLHAGDDADGRSC